MIDEIILKKYGFWCYLEIILFFSYIYSTALYVTCTAVSPFSAYQFYVAKGICNPELDWSQIWGDEKPAG